MTPRVAGVQGAALLNAALCALGGWLAHRANNRLGAALQMRTPQRKAGERGGSVTPPRPAVAPGASWRSSAGGALRKPPADWRNVPGCRGRRPREAAGPPSYGGQLRPSTYGATERAARNRGQAAPKGHRHRRLWPGGGAWCVLRLARAQPPPWRRSGKRAAPGADPRATVVERAKRAEPARRPAARVGRGRPAGRGVRAAAARQQGAPLPCIRYCSVGPGQRAACAQPGRGCWIRPGGAACERTFFGAVLRT